MSRPPLSILITPNKCAYATATSSAWDMSFCPPQHLGREQTHAARPLHTLNSTKYSTQPSTCYTLLAPDGTYLRRRSRMEPWREKRPAHCTAQPAHTAPRTHARRPLLVRESAIAQRLEEGRQHLAAPTATSQGEKIALQPFSLEREKEGVSEDERPAPKLSASSPRHRTRREARSSSRSRRT